MFLKYIISGSGLVAIAAFVSWLCCVHLRDEDRLAYRKYVRESADLISKQALEKSPISQLRTNVAKDIWMVSHDERTHLKLHSASSDLTLIQKKEKLEAIENLTKMELSDGYSKWRSDAGQLHFPSLRCNMFEVRMDRIEDQRLDHSFISFSCPSLDYQSKTVFFSSPFEATHLMGQLTGTKGIVNHIPCKKDKTSHLLLEEGVKFESIRYPLSISSRRALAELPSDRSLSSIQEIRFLDEVEIAVAPDLRAQGNTAVMTRERITLYPEQSLSTATDSVCTLVRGSDVVTTDEIRFFTQSKEFYCLAPNGHLEENNTYFQADTGHILLSDDFRPARILLEGNVLLTSAQEGKESCALADSAVLYVEDRRIMLASAPSNRVLFWQEGLELSAPEIRIQKTVQGIGDVRFSFNPEEKHLVNKKFPKIL